MLFKKLGSPQETISRRALAWNRGRTNRSCIFPKKKGTKAAMAVRAMPRLLPRAAPRMPIFSTPINSSSKPMQATDMKMFKNMLRRIFPQMRR